MVHMSRLFDSAFKHTQKHNTQILLILKNISFEASKLLDKKISCKSERRGNREKRVREILQRTRNLITSTRPVSVLLVREICLRIPLRRYRESEASWFRTVSHEEQSCLAFPSLPPPISFSFSLFFSLSLSLSLYLSFSRPVLSSSVKTVETCWRRRKQTKHATRQDVGRRHQEGAVQDPVHDSGLWNPPPSAPGAFAKPSILPRVLLSALPMTTKRNKYRPSRGP